MTIRELPLAEWGRLAGTELGPAVSYLDPAKTTVFVVEDGDEIIGCWAALTVIHAEGVWIAEAHRKRGRVMAQLWRAMSTYVQDHGFRSVVTAARTGEIRDWLDRRGGIRLRDTTPYVLSMESFPKRIRPSEYAVIGAWFHEQLGEHVTHDDDPTHNDAVGRAMVRAIGQSDPVGAVASYNEWAVAHCYQPVRYLGRDHDREVVDFGEGTVVGVDAQYRVTIYEQEPVCRE